MIPALGETISALIGPTRGLLVDFDGPVCAIFGRFPAADAASQLRLAAVQLGINLPANLAMSFDPIEILSSTSREDREAGAALEPYLTDIELSAIKSATPSAGADDLLRAAGKTQPLMKAIVSNNSAKAIAAYLDRHDLTSCLDAVIGRPPGRPEAMKPDPQLIHDAVAYLGLDHNLCILIGDSATDVEAARRAGIATIGYANKPGKARRLQEAGAAVVITDLHELLPFLTKIPGPGLALDLTGENLIH